MKVDKERLERFQKLGQQLVGRWIGGERRGEAMERDQRSLIMTALEASTTSGTIPAPYLFFYHSAVMYLEAIYRESGRDAQAIALLKRAVEQQPQDATFRHALVRLYRKAGLTALAEEQELREVEWANRSVLGTTRKNYRAAVEILRRHEIRIVAMQYPMRSIGLLRNVLNAADDVTFVDNQAVFQEAVGRLGFKALFWDRFAGDFGHLTRKGNDLLSRHLIRTVFDPLLSHGEGPRPPAGSGQTGTR